MVLFITNPSHPTMFSWLTLVITILSFLLQSQPVYGDYECICNFHTIMSIFTQSSMFSPVLGHIGHNQCVKYLYPVDSTWSAVFYNLKVGFIQSDSVTVQTCPGDMVNIYTFTSTTTFTTSKTSTTTTPSPILTGHTELCPQKAKNEIGLFNGFLAQKGDYCYEFVNINTTWHNARRHCQTVSVGGDLVDILNVEAEAYVQLILARHGHTEPLWIGLTDSTDEGAAGEGMWKWTSGAAYSYNNFGHTYHAHSAPKHNDRDCVLMLPNGDWTDEICHPPLLWNFQHGPRPTSEHTFICQFKVVATDISGPFVG